MPTPLFVTLIVFGGLLLLSLLLFLLYLLVLVRPASRLPEDPTLLTDYAHRGLHGNGVPENSMAAFRLAVEAGYGIELDVHLSRDGEVVVFHDDTLLRMTGREGRISDYTLAELRPLRLSGTEEGIPTFAEVLTLVNGRVPLLVELKGESFDRSLCPRVAALLQGYTGRYAIESFNPLLLSEMRKLLPHAYRGLLYTNVVREKKRASVLNLLLTAMALNVVAKPHFISYNEQDRASFPVGLTTRLYRAVRFVWTVRTKEALDTAHENRESPIFEKIDRN